MANTPNLYGSKLEVGQAQKEATINAFFDLLDAAESGRFPLVLTGGTRILKGTVAEPEAQNKFFDVSGNLASAQIVEVPVSATSGRSRVTVWKNGTSGAFSLTVRKVGGTGVTVTQGHTAILLYNDSDIVKLYEVNHTTGLISSAVLSVEGSWTPGIAFGGSSTGVTYILQIGRYTQIGNQVTVHCHIALSNKGSATGNLTITGLPVAHSSTSNQIAVVGGLVQPATYTGTPFFQVTGGTTAVTVYIQNNGAVANLTDAGVANNTDIQFTLTYRTN